MKIGTAISKIATPIAGALGADCYDPKTRDLKPDSPCAKARKQADEARNVRELGYVFYDRFFKRKGGTRMENEDIDYILQIGVTAKDAPSALSNKDQWKVISINPRPQRVTPPQPTAKPAT